MALTNAEHQALLRTRRKAEGLKEIRNTWAHPEDHAKIKAYAAKLAKARLA